MVRTGKAVKRLHSYIATLLYWRGHVNVYRQNIFLLLCIKSPEVASDQYTHSFSRTLSHILDNRTHSWVNLLIASAATAKNHLKG